MNESEVSCLASQMKKITLAFLCQAVTAVDVDADQERSRGNSTTTKKKTKTVKTSVTQINPEPISCLINAVEPYMYVPLTSWPQKQAAELQINRI